MSLISYLEQKNVPTGRPALIEAEICGNYIITFGELWDRIDQLALGLHKLGIQPQDRVALALPNSIAWILTFLAVLKIGGVVVPLRPSLSPVEIKRRLMHCKPSLFIGDSSFINRSLPFDLLEGMEQVVICSKRFMRRNLAHRIIRIDDLLKQGAFRGSNHPWSGSDTLERQVATINYTFRGYGYPVGAMLTHSNYICGIETYLRTTGLREGQRSLLVLPLSHVYPLVGCLLSQLAIGSTVIIVRSPTAQKIWKAISEHQPNVLTGVPSLYATLLRSENRSLMTNLRIEEAFCGGSFMSVTLYNEVQNHWNISLRQGYGLTECLPVTCNPAADNRPQTLGRIGVGVEIRVFGEDGREKSIGEVGEIVVAGPTVMSKYYLMPHETSEVLKDGWFYTGDYGWFDLDGYLHFVGVKKRTAKVAGSIVDLTEVERAILTHPSVVSARTYTIPDETWGEVVKAEIVCKSSQLDSKEIRRYLKGRLASYKMPRVQINCI